MYKSISKKSRPKEYIKNIELFYFSLFVKYILLAPVLLFKNSNRLSVNPYDSSIMVFGGSFFLKQNLIKLNIYTKIICVNPSSLQLSVMDSLNMSLICFLAMIGISVNKARPIVESLCAKAAVRVFRKARLILLDNDVSPIESIICKTYPLKSVVIQHGLITELDCKENGDGFLAAKYLLYNSSCFKKLNPYIKCQCVGWPGDVKELKLVLCPTTRFIWIGQPMYLSSKDKDNEYLIIFTQVFNFLKQHGYDLIYRPHPSEKIREEVNTIAAIGFVNVPISKISVSNSVFLGFDSTAIYEINNNGGFAVQVSYQKYFIDKFGFCSSFEIDAFEKAFGNGVLTNRFEKIGPISQSTSFILDLYRTTL
jgi:hypothetical protein